MDRRWNEVVCLGQLASCQSLEFSLLCRIRLLQTDEGWTASPKEASLSLHQIRDLL
jgi:hypothetical protein